MALGRRLHHTCLQHHISLIRLPNTSLPQSHCSISIAYKSQLKATRSLSTNGPFNGDHALHTFGSQRPKLSLDEIAEASLSQSVLRDLDLWSWWSPSAYYRWALESVHLDAGTPWWTTIVIGTLVFRLAFVVAPLAQERMIFEATKDLRPKTGTTKAIPADTLPSAQLPGMFGKVVLLNTSAFLFQFLAIKGMLDAGYPGFSTGGTLWFGNLTLADPYFVLPAISAATFTFIGMKNRLSKEVSPAQKTLFYKYAVPFGVFAVGSQMPAAITLYWATSRMASLAYYYAFRILPIRAAVKLPLVEADAKRWEKLKKDMEKRGE